MDIKLPDQLSILAIYSLIIVGISQFYSICELTRSVRAINNTDGKNKNRLIYRSISLILFLFTISCYVLNCYYMALGANKMTICQKSYKIYYLITAPLFLVVSACLAYGYFEMKKALDWCLVSLDSTIQNHTKFMFGFLTCSFLLASGFQIFWVFYTSLIHKKEYS